MQLIDKKKEILKALAKTVKSLRGEKSQFIHASENDMSTSILSTIERAMKDPQLTTLFKLAESFSMKPSELIRMIEDDLPENFHLIDK